MGLAKEHLNKLGSDRQRAINGRAGQVSAQAANTYDPRLDNRHRGFPNYIGGAKPRLIKLGRRRPTVTTV